MEKLYEQDFSQWVETMADLLAAGEFAALDIENLMEEVRDLSKRECDRLYDLPLFDGIHQDRKILRPL
ncbi:MAG: DUF29 family protein [Synechococcus sp.]|nr:DUF29 family protein [Synechococcus sp.]